MVRGSAWSRWAARGGKGPRPRLVDDESRTAPSVEEAVGPDLQRLEDGGAVQHLALQRPAAQEQQLGAGVLGQQTLLGDQAKAALDSGAQLVLRRPRDGVAVQEPADESLAARLVLAPQVSRCSCVNSRAGPSWKNARWGSGQRLGRWSSGRGGRRRGEMPPADPARQAEPGGRARLQRRSLFSLGRGDAMGSTPAPSAPSIRSFHLHLHRAGSRSAAAGVGGVVGQQVAAAQLGLDLLVDRRQLLGLAGEEVAGRRWPRRARRACRAARRRRPRR